MTGESNAKSSRRGTSPLRRVATEPDVFVVARHKTETAKSEILTDFKRLRSGDSTPTEADIRQFERKWVRGCRDVENRVFAAGFAPEARPYVEQLRPILAEIYELVQDCAAVLERNIDRNDEREVGSETTPQQPTDAPSASTPRPSPSED